MDQFPGKRWLQLGLQLGLLSLALQGCGDSKPTPQSHTCSETKSNAAQSYTKPCDHSEPRQLDTPDVTVKSLWDEKGFLQMELRIGNNTFKAMNRSDFQSLPKNLTRVLLEPVDSTRKEKICVDYLHDKDMIIITDDFTCPSCQDPKAKVFVWFLVAYEINSGFLCPEKGASLLHPSRETKSLQSWEPTQNHSKLQNVFLA